MKRTILLFLIVQTISFTTYGQTVHYGLFSGTQRVNSSYFGWSAGQLASPSSRIIPFSVMQVELLHRAPNNIGFGTKTLFSHASGSGRWKGCGYETLSLNEVVLSRHSKSSVI